MVERERLRESLKREREREFAAIRRELLRDCTECDMLPRATVGG